MLVVMTPRGLWVLAVALASAPASSGEAVSGLEHAALPCVPIGRYASVTARSAAPGGRAELQCRGGAAGGCYAMRTAEHGGRWTALLPRPAGARQSEYRIVMAGSDSVSATSPDITVAVQEACDSDA